MFWGRVAKAERPKPPPRAAPPPRPSEQRVRHHFRRGSRCGCATGLLPQLCQRKGAAGSDGSERACPPSPAPAGLAQEHPHRRTDHADQLTNLHREGGTTLRCLSHASRGRGEVTRTQNCVLLPRQAAVKPFLYPEAEWGGQEPTPALGRMPGHLPGRALADRGQTACVRIRSGVASQEKLPVTTPPSPSHVTCTAEGSPSNPSAPWEGRS